VLTSSLKNIFSAPIWDMRFNFELQWMTASQSAHQTNQACGDKTPLKPNAGLSLRSQVAWFRALLWHFSTAEKPKTVPAHSS
jgi:hypothetical protein